MNKVVNTSLPKVLLIFGNLSLHKTEIKLTMFRKNDILRILRRANQGEVKAALAEFGVSKDITIEEIRRLLMFTSIVLQKTNLISGWLQPFVRDTVDQIFEYIERALILWARASKGDALDFQELADEIVLIEPAGPPKDTTEIDKAKGEIERLLQQLETTQNELNHVSTSFKKFYDNAIGLYRFTSEKYRYWEAKAASYSPGTLLQRDAAARANSYKDCNSRVQTFVNSYTGY